jgi:hypothetical protein
MDLWQITYTSIITGERQTYMNIGFETPERAKDEIERLKVAAKKYKKLYYNINESYAAGVYLPTAAIGKYWRVKKVKCKPA